MRPYALGIGAANIDLMGRSNKGIVMADSNPGQVSVSVGGVTHNICENAAKMGVNVTLITAVGDDHYGRFIREHCERSGIDTSCFYTASGHPSSTYLSIHQPDGDMAVALSDMGVLQQLSVSFLEGNRAVLEQASAIVVDCGLPEEILRYVSGEFGPRVPVFVDPVSTTYAEKLAGSLAGYHTVKPNLLEAEVLSGMKIRSEADLSRAAGKILDSGVGRLIISLGRDGVYYADQEGCSLRAATRPLGEVANATGAGDAFMAGLLYAYLEDFTLEKTLDVAMTAAILAISHRETINPDMSCRLIEENIPKYKK